MCGWPSGSACRSPRTSRPGCRTSTRPIHAPRTCGSTTGSRSCRRPWSTPSPSRPPAARARRPRSPAAAATLGPMLTLHAALRDKIVAHARADHPDEACGVIAGPAGQDRPERFIPMLNAQRSPTFYEFDSMELLRVWREMDDRDEEPAVIYHSHTATEAYPSRTDISYANEPGAHYVLVSTRDPDTAEFRSFRIVDGTVTEEEVRITDDVPGDPSPAPAGPGLE